MLTIQEAEYELERGAEMNFGPWKMLMKDLFNISQ